MAEARTSAFPPGIAERVGEKSREYAEAVPEERLKAFSTAVGARLQGGQAPATYLTTCRKGEFEFFEKLGVPLSRVLHVEQEYSYGEPIVGGDTLHYRTELLSSVEKGKGKMLFLVFQTQVRIARGASWLEAGVAKSTIVVRAAE